MALDKEEHLQIKGGRLTLKGFVTNFFLTSNRRSLYYFITSFGKLAFFSLVNIPDCQNCIIKINLSYINLLCSNLKMFINRLRGVRPASTVENNNVLNIYIGI